MVIRANNKKGKKTRNRKKKKGRKEQMIIVPKDQKGINVKLNPKLEDRIFTDYTEDEQHVHIVKGVIVRVDTPSAKMHEALTRKSYQVSNNELVPKETLLVETDDDPTSPLADPKAGLSGPSPSITLAQLREAASIYGLTLQPEDGNKTVVRPVVEEDSGVVASSTEVSSNQPAQAVAPAPAKAVQAKATTNLADVPTAS